MLKWFTAFVLIISISMCGLGCKKKSPAENFDWLPNKTLGVEVPTLGEGRNNETTYNDEVHVNPISNLNEDFINGMDISMVHQVEQSGGVYYNEDGVEQDVFEILADNGVNYARIRLWNNPSSPYGVNGGGNLSLPVAISLAKRAERVGMKVMVDFHYSDTWADPETQTIPYDWFLLTKTEMVAELEKYTKEALNAFKQAGVTVSMVQIGNEINNGMLWESGRLVWNNPASYDYVAELLKAGIKGAKAAFPNIKTVIHLADGGMVDIFETFFDNMRDRNVDYDMIGASFYPYYHGTMQQLSNVLNTISAKYNKRVMVAETSYAFTLEGHAEAANIFNEGMQANGGYMATVQGQATAIRDVIEVVNSVPNKMGVGIFYWEPAWLPVRGAGWAEEGTKATWSNQAFFSYSGKVLPSLKLFDMIKNAEYIEAEILSLKDTELDIRINLAASETLPSTVLAFTSQDAYKPIAVTWTASEVSAITSTGSYVVHGVVTQGNKSFNVVANVTAIENFVSDPSFELGRTVTYDEPVFAPWRATFTPESESVLKVQTKGNHHSGVNHVNYYSDKAFSFDLSQEITIANGTYNLSVYIQGEAGNKMTELYLYASGFGGSEMRANTVTTGHAAWKHVVIEGIVVTNGKIVIGVYGSASVGTWGHIDDFELVSA